MTINHIDKIEEDQGEEQNSSKSQIEILIGMNT